MEPRAFPAGEDVTEVHAKALSDTCQNKAASDTCPGQEQATAGLLIQFCLCAADFKAAW